VMHLKMEKSAKDDNEIALQRFLIFGHFAQ
jgi:hypothetical protein